MNEQVIWIYKWASDMHLQLRKWFEFCGKVEDFLIRELGNS
jgi:hypothetical protein